MFAGRTGPNDVNKEPFTNQPMRMCRPLALCRCHCCQLGQEGGDGLDKCVRQNANVSAGNLIRMSCVSLSNSGYFAVIYLCLLSGERLTDGRVHLIKEVTREISHVIRDGNLSPAND